MADTIAAGMEFPAPLGKARWCRAPTWATRAAWTACTAPTWAITVGKANGSARSTSRREGLHRQGHGQAAAVTFGAATSEGSVVGRLPGAPRAPGDAERRGVSVHTTLQLMVDGLSMGMVYVLMASGFNLIMSVPHIMFIAFGEFYMLGAFIVWYVRSPADMNFFAACCRGRRGGLASAGLSYLLVFRPLQSPKEPVPHEHHCRLRADDDPRASGPDAVRHGDARHPLGVLRAHPLVGSPCQGQGRSDRASAC